MNCHKLTLLCDCGFLSSRGDFYWLARQCTQICHSIHGNYNDSVGIITSVNQSRESLTVCPVVGGTQQTASRRCNRFTPHMYCTPLLCPIVLRHPYMLHSAQVTMYKIFLYCAYKRAFTRTTNICIIVGFFYELMLNLLNFVYENIRIFCEIYFQFLRH